MGDSARGTTLALLAVRIPNGSVCPSDAARAIASGADWRDAMASFHAAVDLLLAEKLIQLSSKSEILTCRVGPYRIRRPIEN